MITRAMRSSTLWGVAASVMAIASSAGAGNGVLSENGELELSINARLIPTQDDLDTVAEQLRRTQPLLCDATDGRIKLRRVTVTRRESDEKRADAWWYPVNGRETSSLLGLGNPSMRFILFGNSRTASTLPSYLQQAEVRPVNVGALSFSTAATIAHELGHYLLGVGDSYAESQRFGTNCDIGQGFDKFGFFDDGVTPSREDVQWNSLQQSPAQVCLDASGAAFGNGDAFLAAVPCADDSTCTPFGTGVICGADPIGTELATAQTFDRRLAPWTQGGPPAACPSPRPATDMYLVARVNPLPAAIQSLAGIDFSNEFTINISMRLEAFDELGLVADGSSSHSIHVPLVRYEAQRAMLIVLVDHDEYASPPPSVGKHTPFNGGERDVLEVARFALEFDTAGKLTQINGLPIQPDGSVIVNGVTTFPQIRIGGGVAESFGAMVDGAQGQSVDTGPFHPSPEGTVAQPLTLNLHLAGIEMLAYSVLDGSAGNSAYFCSDPVTCRNRNGIIASRIEAAGGLPQLARCTDDGWCAATYNPVTGAFDGTDHTLRSILRQAALQGMTIRQFLEQAAASGQPARPASEWEEFFANYGTTPNNRTGIHLQGFVAPRDLPDPLPPADCGPPVDIVFDDIQVPNRFMIVLDRSGSMLQETGVGGVGAVTRLDFVKAAARAVVQSFTGSATEVGLVTFDHNVTVDRALTSAHSQVTTAIDAVTSQDGLTAIGSGLRVAAEQIRAAGNPAGNGILLLTDGENNRPCGCVDPQTRARTGCSGDPEPVCTDDPPQVASDLERDITVYTVPVGSTADRDGLAQIAATTGGEMFDTETPDQVIPTFVEAYAAFRGTTPILATVESDVAAAEVVVRDTPSPTINEFTLPIEQGASRLDVLLSVRDSDPNQWSPTFRLLRPDGSVAADESSPPSVLATHPFFRLVRIPAPAAGEWKLRVLAPTSGRTKSYILAHVQNPGPDCFAAATPRRSDGSSDVTITASASSTLPLESGVTFSGVVLRPDGTEVSIPFHPPAPGSTDATATFPASTFAGRGIYDVKVTCSVAADARPMRGEGEPPKAENDAPVEAFERTARAYFFLDVADLPDPPNSGDWDRDGIPNTAEPDGDLDGDGLPNARDDDADGDDIWDGHDPDPFDPAVTGRACAATPPSIGCCTNPGTCPGTQDFVLYADGELELADRARAIAQGGEPAAVVNAGATRTLIAPDAVIGSLTSDASVTLNERAAIHGDLLTAGTLIGQNNTTVAGNVTEHADLSTPGLASFQVPFPSGSLGDVTLEPDATGALLPNSYGTLTLRSRSSLALSSGTYYLQALLVEPDATVQLDTTGGPVFLYVQQALTFRGKQVGASGHGLFIGYFGQNNAWIEAPFAGTVVAPNSELVLSTVGSFEHRGSFFAKSILVRADVRVRHEPFPHPWAAGAGKLLSGRPRIGSDPSPRSSGGCALEAGGRYRSAWPLLALLPALALAARHRRRQERGTRAT